MTNNTINLFCLDSPVQEYNVPKCYRDDALKWNGWGYIDSQFQLTSKKDVYMKSNRYDELNGKLIPNLRSFIEKNLGVNFDIKTPSVRLSDVRVSAAIEANKEFLIFLRKNKISFTNSGSHRLVRSHGQTLHEIFSLRKGEPWHYGRIPDLVVWPQFESDVKKIINEANLHNIVLIPIGGGTCVSDALTCSSNEKRYVCSVDMTLMNKILWINESSLVCRAQAGIIGQDLERQLNEKGFTCGHEPDSIEFSSLGGWISTRASGMKKNKYGNIEDILIHANLITAKGILQRQCQVPRISSGPDLHQVILGSEGTYGIITEATLKIFPLPECRRYGSIVFPTFFDGIAFFKEVAKQKLQCASLRLVDNQQFQMGQAMKTKSESLFQDITSSLSKLYITKWKKFDIEKIVAVTCVFEGSVQEVKNSSSRLYNLATCFKGIEAGEENGRYGYRLTFAIAYLRDLAMDYSVVGESFETSIPWEKVEDVCNNVTKLLKEESIKHGIKHPVLATSRVTQIYDTGACVYFYYGFNYEGLKEDPAHVFSQIENAARNEIIACGGSISHHHGVGKHRKQWLPDTVSSVGVSILKSLKNNLDPKNIFANNNLIDINDNESKL